MTGAGPRSFLAFASDPAQGCRLDTVAPATFCPESSAPADYVDHEGVNRTPPASPPEIPDQPTP